MERPDLTCDCPYCGNKCEADWADVGVGPGIQCGPYYCIKCGASEIGAYDDLSDRVLTSEEQTKGWYGPDSQLGSAVNQVNNTPISIEVANSLYRKGLL